MLVIALLKTTCWCFANWGIVVVRCAVNPIGEWCGRAAALAARSDVASEERKTDCYTTVFWHQTLVFFFVYFLLLKGHKIMNNAYILQASKAVLLLWIIYVISVLFFVILSFTSVY